MANNTQFIATIAAQQFDLQDCSNKNKHVLQGDELSTDYWHDLSLRGTSISARIQLGKSHLDHTLTQPKGTPSRHNQLD